MSKKKKLTKQQRKEQRIHKGKQWLLTYSGSKVVRSYCKRFCVDVVCAINDLKEIGFEFTAEHLEKLKRDETLRLHQRAIEKEKKKAKENGKNEIYGEDSDDTFFFIAGYTSGGAPYGVTLAEMGLEPYEELDEYNTGGYADTGTSAGKS